MTKLSSDPTISSGPAESLRPFIVIVSCAVGCALLAPKIGSGYAEGRTHVFLGALFLVAAVAWRFPAVAAWSARHERLVVFLGAALLVLPLFGKDLQAEWGIIDDHEIMTYLGPRERLPIAEVPSRLMQKEVGQPGKSLRYRPAYYLLRLMETALWGKNCTLWYLARIVILTVSIALTWLLLRPAFGFVASALFLAYLMSLQFWCDIFAKLGPAEAYIVFGLALFCVLRQKADRKPIRAGEVRGGMAMAGAFTRRRDMHWIEGKFRDFDHPLCGGCRSRPAAPAIWHPRRGEFPGSPRHDGIGGGIGHYRHGECRL